METTTTVDLPENAPNNPQLESDDAPKQLPPPQNDTATKVFHPGECDDPTNVAMVSRTPTNDPNDPNATTPPTDPEPPRRDDGNDPTDDSVTEESTIERHDVDAHPTIFDPGNMNDPDHDAERIVEPTTSPYAETRRKRTHEHQGTMSTTPPDNDIRTTTFDPGGTTVDRMEESSNYGIDESQRTQPTDNRDKREDDAPAFVRRRMDPRTTTPTMHDESTIGDARTFEYEGLAATLRRRNSSDDQKKCEEFHIDLPRRK